MKIWHKWPLLFLLAGSVLCRGQGTDQTPGVSLASEFVPGQSVRYEFDGIFHFTSQKAANVKADLPQDCSYRLRTLLKLDFGKQAEGGSFTGRVSFPGLNINAWSCGSRVNPALISALQKLQSSPVDFQVSPTGEVRLDKMESEGSEYEGMSLLFKAAWDVLQTQISDGPVSPSEAWIPSRHFLYWPDTFVKGLSVAAASMQYERDVQLADHNYALIHFKHVFSPEDMPAYVEARNRARDFTGTNFVAGSNSLSLLFDPTLQRVVYLRRNRTVDTRLFLKYDRSSANGPVLSYVIEEESTLRWLPDKNSGAWLAELRKFENTPLPMERAPVMAAKEAISGPSLGEVALVTRRERQATGQRAAMLEDLNRVPKGFQRWSKNYCYSGFCFEMSLAVPADTKVAESEDTTALLLAGTGEKTITIAVGPVFDRQFPGLRDEELLQRENDIYLTNYLWFAGGRGKALNFASVTLDDRGAGISEFTAVARDLSPIRGRLVMVIAPFERLLPVTCSYVPAQREQLDGICQTVTISVRAR